MTNKHYARKLLLLLWLPFDAVHGSFTSELVLVRAPGLKWMLRMCWRMIKLQCNHICVWLISSDICSMHFSSFSLHLRDAQRRSFRRQHFISPCRLSKNCETIQTNWMRSCCIPNETRNYLCFGKVAGGLGKWFGFHRFFSRNRSEKLDEFPISTSFLQ